MGLSCKIHKSGDNILLVEAPNTEPSKLFNDAYNMVKSKNKALKIWASAYTLKFKEFYSNDKINILPSVTDKLKVMSNYKGMFSNKTNITFYDDIFSDNVQGRKGYMFFYKGLKARIEMMKPSDYLKKVRDGFNTNIDEGITRESKSNILNGIANGNKIDIPYLSNINNRFAQEGRNRATVAMEKGEDLIPVMVVESVTYDEKVETAKNVIQEFISNNSVESKDDLMNKFISKYKPHRDMISFIRNNVLDSININNDVIQKFPKSLKLDTNGEPNINDVIKFLDNIENKVLSKIDLFEIGNNMVNMGVKSVDELYPLLKDTFIDINGNFIISKNNLEKSKLYTDIEISNILKDTNLQSNIKKLVDKIEQSFISDTDVSIDYSMYDGEYNIVDYNSTIGLGKYKVINPYDIDKHIANVVGSIKNRKLFEERLHDIQYESIIDKYFNDKVFSDKLFDKYSNMEKYNVYKIENDVLKNVIHNDTKTLLKETLISKIDNTELRLNFKFLDSISEDVWDENSANIKKLLKDISNNLIRFNIDIIGIENTYDEYNMSDIKDFIYELYNFTNKLNSSNVSDNDISYISDKIDTYISNNNDNMYEVGTVNINNQGKTLLKLNISDSVNEVELFQKFGIIKTIDKGIYHKVEVIDNTNDLYDILYNMVVLNRSILPDGAYYPTGYNSKGNISLSNIKNLNNKEDIISDIKRYVNKNMNTINDSDNIDNVVLEKLFIYKKLFKHPININSINMYEVSDNYNNFNGDFTYLTDRFISDFRKLQLKGKYNNTLLYDEVLSKFIIDERGITMTSSDPITVSNINTLYSSKLNNLKQYSFLSKDSNMNTVFNKTTEPLTKKSKANIYRNNINLLERFNGEYNINNNILVSKNSKDEFLRVKEGLFMKVYDEYNNSYYKNVPIYNNSNVNNFINITNKVKNLIPAFNSNNLENYSDIVKLYNNAELDSINEKIDNCEG